MSRRKRDLADVLVAAWLVTTWIMFAAILGLLVWKL